MEITGRDAADYGIRLMASAGDPLRCAHVAPGSRHVASAVRVSSLPVRARCAPRFGPGRGVNSDRVYPYKIPLC